MSNIGMSNSNASISLTPGIPSNSIFNITIPASLVKRKQGNLIDLSTMNINTPRELSLLSELHGGYWECLYGSPVHFEERTATQFTLTHQIENMIWSQIHRVAHLTNTRLTYARFKYYLRTGLELTCVMPDVALVANSPKTAEECCDDTPTIVAEIWDKSVSKQYRAKKTLAYIEAGVQALWIVDPDTCTVTVDNFDEEERPRVYGLGDVINVIEPLPFVFDISKLFNALRHSKYGGDIMQRQTTSSKQTKGSKRYTSQTKAEENVQETPQAITQAPSEMEQSIEEPPTIEDMSWNELSTIPEEYLNGRISPEIEEALQASKAGEVVVR